MAIRILVVDDERIIADTLATILRSSGYDCRTAYDGAQALDLVDVFEPNLVISDVAMPNLTGIELYHQLKAKPNAPAVMLLSGNVQVLEMLSKEQQSGHRLEVISKPIPPQKLLSSVAQMVKGFSA
jgi:CheY-like chemotaxis protein